MKNAIRIAAAFAILAAAGCAREPGLILHYTFDKVAVDVVADESGSGNLASLLGKPDFVKSPHGLALALDGVDDYLECDTGWESKLESATLMLWCRPEAVRGGLFNFTTGDKWKDRRLALAINTDYGDPQLMLFLSGGDTVRHFERFEPLPSGQWTHLAVTLSKTHLRLYRNGLLELSAIRPVTPGLEGVPLWIGRTQGLGKTHFQGLIDDVRIYDRPLTRDEISIHYKRSAKPMPSAVHRGDRPRIDVEPYPDAQKLLVNVDLRPMAPLPDGTRLDIDIATTESKAILTQHVAGPFPMRKLSAVFRLADLQPGTYLAIARIIGPDGAPVGTGAAARFHWAARSPAFGSMKVLNNLTWELLRLGPAKLAGKSTTHTFTCPLDRWVYIKSTARAVQGGELFVGIDSKYKIRAAIVHSEDGVSTWEAMRRVKAGTHTIHVTSRGAAFADEIIVRAIPILQYAYYPWGTKMEPFGPYDREFLSKDVLPNMNTLIVTTDDKDPYLREWRKRGRSIVGRAYVHTPKTTGPAAAKEVLDYWSGNYGFQNPLYSGIVIDEFTCHNAPLFDASRDAVRQIHSDPKFAGRRVMPYFYGICYGNNRGAGFVKACIETGGSLCWERYLPEQPSLAEAHDWMKGYIVDSFKTWQKAIPGVARGTVVVLGILSVPSETCNVDPTVDFKVYLDMQCRLLATHPAFFGLGGVQTYSVLYSDEETIRWAGRLFRHYFIEGNTTLLSEKYGFKYKLSHITNPDFERGLEGWTIDRAEPDSIRTASHPAYSWLQGRFRRTTQGDTFLLAKRSARAPNTFSRRIKDLVPGKLYSLKMITADYQDLLQEKSEEERHAVTIRLDGVEPLTGPRKSFQFPIKNNYSHLFGKFDGRKYGYWMNYHWRVFRARAESATLTVSDWASREGPGGPVGQELMFNFIEIQPYLDD